MLDEERNQDLDPADAVAVAYVVSNDVTYSWHRSMTEMMGWDLVHKGRIMQGGYIGRRCGTNGLVQARNSVVADFLDGGTADWLFWIDTDMGFAPDTLDRLMEAADPIERPIVGALAFSQRETGPDGMGGWRTAATPTIFDWQHLDGQQGFAIRWNYTQDVVTRCAGTGSAAILIHRSVFEAVKVKFGPVWYDRIPNQSIGELTSEDLSFCMRVAALDIPLFVHTGVKTTHQKLQWLGEYDYLRHSPAPPAAEQAAVIVPVMRRPQNAAPFMASLRASTGMATVYAMAHTDDVETIDAWTAAGAQVITDDVTTFAQKCNLGYRKTGEPWLFLVGDDVRFHPGWLDRAQRAGGSGYGVVGTNDLSNPRVTSGEHATHLLVRREYVDRVGGGWDGPGVVAHEGYRHWFVDDEVVAAAKARGMWAMALDSVVEHLHPMWGKADNDDVYELGQSFSAADRKVFEARCQEFL